MRKAMELSVLCGCDIAMFMFAPNDQLAQYTSSDMEGLLNKYSRRCQEAHETRTNRDVRLHHLLLCAAHKSHTFTDIMCDFVQLLQVLPPGLAADVVALHPSRHTQRDRMYTTFKQLQKSPQVDICNDSNVAQLQVSC